MILFSSKKTIKWLDTKSAKEVEHLMQIARKKAPAFKKLLNKEGRTFLKDALMHFIFKKNML